MKLKILTTLVFGSILFQISYSQEDPVKKGLEAINQEVLKAQLGFLASDWTEGREAGQRGEFLAGDYIASLLQLYGVKPGGDYRRSGELPSDQGETQRTYFQNITLIKTTPGEEQILEVKTTQGMTIKTVTLVRNVDFYTRPIYQSTEMEAPVIFAGYGFKNEKLKYNDYINLDVKGKFIIRISGFPGIARDKLTSAELSASSGEAENMLKNMGIAGIIEFNPGTTTAGFHPDPDFLNMSPSEGRQRAGRSYERYSLPDKTSPEGLIRITVSAKAADEILKGSGINIDEYIRKADSGKSGVIPELTSKTVYFKSDVNTTAIQARNVIGIVEGNNPDQIIVLGAHYDHLGMANGYIWNGADDNASGTVGVLTLAKAVMETGRKPDKTIVFALWTGEEKGLLGSHYYVDNLDYPLKNLRLNVNFDMISRYISEDNRNGVIMTYTSSYPKFKSITEDNLKSYGISLEVDYQGSVKPAGPSDESTFVNAGVPIIRIKTAHREEYHTPDDELSTIDWDIMEKIVRISFVNVWELANSSW
jgi:Peptidase family M28